MSRLHKNVIFHTQNITKKKERKNKEKITNKKVTKDLQKITNKK
tara:strand:+ start:1100 stop:1231 length:132 start_codon:yes stop_codon:yes gene_type:complete